MAIRVDDSLARGFRNAFLRYVEAEQERVFNRVGACISGHDHGPHVPRKKAHGFMRELDGAAKSPLVLHRRTLEARRLSRWWYVQPYVSKDYPVNNWQENVLTLEYTIVLPLQQVIWTDTKRFHFTVSTHAIQRIFQRISWPELPTEKSIIPELAELVLYAPAWWSALLSSEVTADGAEEKFRYLAFIPTQHGAFLGNFDEPMLDLRTFICTEQMTQKQLSLWKDAMQIHASFDPILRLDENILLLVSMSRFELDDKYLKIVEEANRLIHDLCARHSDLLMPERMKDYF